MEEENNNLTTQTDVGHNASNNHSGPLEESPQSLSTVNQHDNRPDKKNSDDDEVTNPSIYHIMKRYLGDPVLSQFRGLYCFPRLRSKLTRD